MRPIIPGGTLWAPRVSRKTMPAFSAAGLPLEVARISARLARRASILALICSGVRSSPAPLMPSLSMYLATRPLRSKSLPQWARASRMTASAAARSLPGTLAAMVPAWVMASASYWPWSMRMEVEVTVPSTPTVTVQLNLTGKFSGSLMKTETAPVAASFAMVYSTGMCSLASRPNSERHESWPSWPWPRARATESSCAGWAAVHSSRSLAEMRSITGLAFASEVPPHSRVSSAKRKT